MSLLPGYLDERFEELVDYHLNQPNTIDSQDIRGIYVNPETGKLTYMKQNDERYLRQVVQKILETERKRYYIYSSNYGTEFENLIEAQLPRSLLISEIPRLIREAILVDPRFSRVDDINIEFMNDEIHVSSTVVKSIDNENITIVESVVAKT